MTFYQRASLAPTSLRGILSCCYGSRQGRPSSPDDRPGSPPAEEEAVGNSSVASGHQNHHLNNLSQSEPDENPPENDPQPAGEPDALGDEIPGDSLSKETTQVPPPWESPPSEDSPRPVGCLALAVRYDCADRQVAARVIRTLDLRQPSPSDVSGRWNSLQVSLALLPGRKQRHRTEMVKGDSQLFGETFVFTNIYASELPRLAIRFRVYGCERSRRKLPLGECALALGTLAAAAQDGGVGAPPGLEEILQLPLLPCRGARSNVGSDTGFSEASSTQAGSCASVLGTAELFLGLSYNGKTGQLAVEVMKGSGFRMPGSARVPETAVKMALMASNSQILFKSKSTFAGASPNPLWKENFMFPVNKFQLGDVTIVVSIYAKKSIKRRELIGWFAIGRNSSGEEETAHWKDMLDSKAEQISRWHRLLHPDEKK